jgi:hypothetical protein
MAETHQDCDHDKTADRSEIPPHQREKAKEDDNHTCQFCARKSPEEGGNTPLHVHHKSYDPDDCDLHDLDNLITLCIHCHHWMHSKPTPDTTMIEITEETAIELIPVDFEIVELLNKEGPLTTEAIAERIRPEKSPPAVEERLWRIMGIDAVVDDQPQLIDQDATTGRWGLPHQIDTSERRIPDAVQEIVQRTIDSLVAAAIERGCDRETVTTVFGLHKRTTYRIQYRGQAYDFPVSMYTGQGRPREDGDTIDHPSATEGADEPASQQQLDALVDENTHTSSETATTADGGTECVSVTANGDTDTVSDLSTTSGGTDTDGSSASGDSDDSASGNGGAGGDGDDSASGNGGDSGDATDGDAPPEKEPTHDDESIEHYETVDPNQPQIDGSNREWLITADDFPEHLRPTIHRLNIAKIAYREQGNPSVDPSFDPE